jgi:hypothetical protein
VRYGPLLAMQQPTAGGCRKDAVPRQFRSSFSFGMEVKE